MKVSAKVDYAVRAAVQLAAAEDGASTKADAIASAQDIPLKFLENILQGLRNGGLVTSRRGPDGGHALARPANEITLADVVRAIDESDPARVVYVACDPVALARDLKTFSGLGWRPVRLRAFDLFPNTHHLEAVAALERV